MKVANKLNKDAVKDYNNKFTNITVRIPNVMNGIPDYPKLIRDRAKELGFINQKGVDKGQGSANAYILHLVEKDLNIDMIKNMKDLKHKD